MRTVHRDVGSEVDRRGRHVAQPGAATAVLPHRPPARAGTAGTAGTAAGRRGRRAASEPEADGTFLPDPLVGPLFDPLTDPLPEALLEPLREGPPGAASSPPSLSASPRVPDDTRALDLRDQPPARRPDPGVVRALLRSAVALQAEDLLRSIGALAVAAQRSEGTAAHVDWIGWVERDVRDLGHLARAALEVGATLPAGLDVGGGDPARPETVIEGLLAGHEAVLGVLRHLDAVGGAEPWNAVVGRITARREAEAAALRVTVGDGSPREPEQTHTGRPPDAFFSPDLLC
jgi:hypothetical protein